MKVSIVIPAFNEVQTIAEVLRRIAAADVDAEIVVIDDGSTDGTRDVLQSRHGVTVIFHERNAGKGAALRTGFVLRHRPGRHHPGRRPRIRARTTIRELLQPILAGQGRRRLRLAVPRRAAPRPLLLALAGQLPAHPARNIFTDLNLTDMEICYKVFRTRGRCRASTLQCNRFGFEPEITAKIVASKVPHLRGAPSRTTAANYAAGKKITWRDGVAALHHIVRFNLFPRQRPKLSAPHRVICRPDTVPHAHAGDID